MLQSWGAVTDDSLSQQRAKVAIPEAHMAGALPTDQRAVWQHQHRPYAAALACAPSSLSLTLMYKSCSFSIAQHQHVTGFMT
jgi:hypothetical protein